MRNSELSSAIRGTKNGTANVRFHRRKNVMSRFSDFPRGVLQSFGFCFSTATFALTGSACLVDAQLSTGSPDTKSGEQTSEPSQAENSPSVGDNAETTGTEPGNARVCEAIDGGTCLGDVPFGWNGPVQPQRAKSVDGLAPCKQSAHAFSGPAKRAGVGPNASENVFVDSASASPARCSNEGCGIELETGGCTPMAFVIRRLETESPRKCGEVLPDFPPPFLGPKCQQIDPGRLTAPDHAVGAIPAQPMLSEASCRATGESSSEVEEPVFDSFYRICAGEDEPSASCPSGEACTSFRNRENLGRMSMGCVFKEGDVACPAGAYEDIRVVLFGEAEDDRGCTGCQVEHLKGKLECKYGMRVAKSDPSQTCENSESIRAEDVCITKSDLLGPDGPYSAFGEYLRVEYSGKCEPKPSLPVGEYKLASPVTLCCSEF